MCMRLSVYESFVRKTTSIKRLQCNFLRKPVWNVARNALIYKSRTHGIFESSVSAFVLNFLGEGSARSV